MRDIKRFIAILSLLENAQGTVGKTFLQKGIYILQEGLKEELGYKYKLHFYGPFSQELANDIDTLYYMGLINIQYDAEATGYRIEITEAGKKFLKKYQQNDLEKNKIEKVLSMIDGKLTKKMELLGTVLYFAKLTNDKGEIKRLVNMFKPHFADSEIEESLKRLRKEGMI